MFNPSFLGNIHETVMAPSQIMCWFAECSNRELMLILVVKRMFVDNQMPGQTSNTKVIPTRDSESFVNLKSSYNGSFS